MNRYSGIALVLLLMTACSSTGTSSNVGLGGLPGDEAAVSENGVSKYKCDQLNSDGGEFSFALGVGSPTTKVFAEKLCSCLRAGETKRHANFLNEQIKKSGPDGFMALAATAKLGEGIKKCEAVALQGVN
jgi:hypothetical protein